MTTFGRALAVGDRLVTGLGHHVIGAGVAGRARERAAVRDLHALLQPLVVEVRRSVRHVVELDQGGGLEKPVWALDHLDQSCMGGLGEDQEHGALDRRRCRWFAPAIDGAPWPTRCASDRPAVRA